MPRSIQEILDHADRLASRFENLEREQLTEIPLEEYLLQRAVIARSNSEGEVERSVRRARSKGLSWKRIGSLLGTSAQAAQQRFGATSTEPDTPRSSTRFDEEVEKCVQQMREQSLDVDRPLLEAIARSLGPSLYQRDATLVAAAQKSELATIRKNFLIGRLGCQDGPALDEALEEAVTRIGKSRRNKLRPVFYYLLVKHLGKEAIYRRPVA